VHFGRRVRNPFTEPRSLQEERQAPLTSYVNGENMRKASTKVSTEHYQRLYTILLDAIPSSVLLIDKDMRVVSANRNFLEKSRRARSNTIGHHLEKVFPAVILDHLKLTSQIRQVFEKNQPTSGERMTYRAPGVPMRIYYYRILPFPGNRAAENAMLLMDDVTEQVQLGEEVRRIERHLASIVESASDIVLSTDIEGRIWTWNTSATKLSDYSFHEVKEHFFSEYCTSDEQEDVKKVFASMKRGKGTQMAEWDLITKHGDTIPVSWVLSPMKGDSLQTAGIVAVGRDLTERRKFEAQLFRSQKLAALGVMAGGIAHEVRNPLAICSSAAQFLMDDDNIPEFRKECIEKILTGIDRASIIIENLLRFARPSEKSDMVELNLLFLLNETLNLVKNQARIQKIAMTSHFPKKPVLINGNPSLLQQVFMNLILNAINAMPDGGTLDISAERIANEVAVRVADTGHGLSKPEIEKIFDPFYTTSSVGKGTGLGLSISYSIIKQHSGTIEVESVEGKGSTFIVKLPVI
jgi:PAS domain S-box-containing protein